MKRFYYLTAFCLIVSLYATAMDGVRTIIPAFNSRYETPAGKKDQTITFKQIASQEYGNKIKPVASASSKLPVTVTVVSGPAVMEGGVIRITGVGKVTVQACQPGDAAYNPATVKCGFMAIRKKIRLVANAQIKIYGDPDPVFTYTYTPELVEGDAFTGTVTREPGEAAGTYQIKPADLDLGPNYNLICAPDNLYINKKQIVVSAVAACKKIGETDPDLTYTFSPALVRGDAFEGALSRVAGETAGDYPIQLNTLALTNNYTLTFEPAMFSVIKAAQPLALLKANNIMSPNGDGKNDYLVFEDIESYPDNELKIFDRASRIIYVKRSYDNSFDATRNGQPLNEGSYYYVLDFGPGKLKLKGYFNIIRDNY